MAKNLWWRVILVGVVLVVALAALIPTFFWKWEENVSGLPDWWHHSFLARILPQNNLNLGLDLQGGMDLVVGVNVEDALVRELRYYEEELKEFFPREEIAYEKIEIIPAAKQLVIDFANPEAMRKGEAYLKRNFPELVTASGRDTLHQVYVLTSSAESSIRRRSVEQVRNVLSRRIDAFGLREPEIVIQGENRIRLQLPGAKDPERIKKNLIRSAKLEFMMVEAIGWAREAVEIKEGGRPEGVALAVWTNPFDAKRKPVECYFDPATGVKEGPVSINRRLAYHHRDPRKPDPENEDKCYLLREDLSISGKDLKDARAGRNPDPLESSYLVSFVWDMSAATHFAKLTGEHIGESLAVVLEDEVHSAPVIQARIFNRGQITGNFTLEEAVDLANVLKSGALTVGITFEEERTVGASLGADSIRKGKMAILWGSVAVVFFMIFYYSLAGVIANFALLLNIIFIFAALSLFGATLTLPGLAGIILTVGMAVDANVLIFERIREELRGGKTPYAAIETGYSKAFWAIFDSNLTSLIAALVLLQWGTGPIKGFAVTLSLGIASSMFTALVVSRLIYDLIFYFRKTAPLYIGIKLQTAAGTGVAKEG